MKQLNNTSLATSPAIFPPPLPSFNGQRREALPVIANSNGEVPPVLPLINGKRSDMQLVFSPIHGRRLDFQHVFNVGIGDNTPPEYDELEIIHEVSDDMLVNECLI